ncbi:MAG: HNH endonuclease signature motif containing protein [Candidatus Paceibacterota bacterium]|jgi:hypothetical protein
MLNFQYPEYQDFFAQLLCGGNDSKLSKFKDYFDFQSPDLKREEFNQMRNKLYVELIKRDGFGCSLKIHPDCSKEKSDLVVDHVIPLSSNELNKKIRKTCAEKGKKVPTESWGSNYIGNLILACPRCNDFKKHKFLEKEVLLKIINK